MLNLKMKVLLVLLCAAQFTVAQNRGRINWTADGNSYTRIKDGNIVHVNPATDEETVIIKKTQLTDPETGKTITPQSYEFNSNYTRVLVFTNTAKVWRYRT